MNVSKLILELQKYNPASKVLLLGYTNTNTKELPEKDAYVDYEINIVHDCYPDAVAIEFQLRDDTGV